MRVLLLTLTLSAVFLLACADLQHLLMHITKADYFHTLSKDDQVILVEMAAEGEVGRLGSFIHRVGPVKIRNIIKQLPPHEAQQMEHYVQVHLHRHPQNITAPPATTTAAV